YLSGVSSSSTDAFATFSLDKLPDGNGTFISLSPRQVSVNNDYRAKLKIAANGALTLYLSRTIAGAETTITSVGIPGTYAAGQK
ncbi:hypothetical protein ACC691_40065, partial [Rhizobium johnstonii]|uniref:hypothetical protein n=1 Tax=Rhizobium johnstonii TaxID=3019933 RepID=UPI003F9D3AAB